MVKKIVAGVLILATGGAWIYLDYQNKQEQLAAAEMRKVPGRVTGQREELHLETGVQHNVAAFCIRTTNQRRDNIFGLRSSHLQLS